MVRVRKKIPHYIHEITSIFTLPFKILHLRKITSQTYIVFGPRKAIYFSRFKIITCRYNKIATIEVSLQSLGLTSLILPWCISSRYINLEYSFHPKNSQSHQAKRLQHLVLVRNQISGDWNGRSPWKTWKKAVTFHPA